MSPVCPSHRTDESGDASWMHECNAFLLALQEGNRSEVVPTVCRIHESGLPVVLDPFLCVVRLYWSQVLSVTVEVSCPPMGRHGG